MKKFFIGLAFIFCLILVSCRVENKSVSITYHINETGTTIEKEYSPNYILNKNDTGITQEGYELEDWYFDSSYSSKVTFPYTVTKNEDFYAKWIKLHTIKFMVGDIVYQTTSVKNNETISTFPTPEQTGSTFVGWCSDKNLTVPFNATTPILEDKILYAKFETQTHTIAFMNDSSKLKEIKVEHNSVLSELPSGPTKTGYTFKGWSTSDTAYTPFDLSTQIVEDMTLFAYFEKNTYLVTFINDAEEYDKQTISYNQSALKPKDPIKQGHTFKGWSCKKDEYEPFDFDSKITEPTTLYAFFTKDMELPEPITICFMNGDTVLETQKINKGSTITSIEAPSKIGYAFKGWSIKQNTFEEFNFANKIDSDLILYAFYEINSYTITYVCNNSTFTTQKVDYNTSTTKPDDPILTGYVFIEWCIDETCENPFDFNKKITENTTLYAKFEEVSTHTLTLIVDGQSYSILVNHNFTLDSVELPTKVGYEIKTLYTDQNQTLVFDVTTKFSNDITLYASYSIKSYTITFMNETSILNTQTVTYNSFVTLPSSPSKTGHTFKGWSTKENEFIEFDVTTPITEDKILYAHYTLNTYTVTFMNENTKVSESKVLYDFTVSSLPSGPTKTGYTFRGWSTSDTAYTPFTATTKITQDTTVYAYYEINSYTVTFKSYNKTETKTVKYNLLVTPPTPAIKEGYDFKGWSQNESSLNAFNFEKGITENVTIYAIYEIQKFTVTFMNANSEFYSSETSYNSTAAFPSTTPTKAGFTFKGWSTSEDTFVEFKENTKITTHLTIYAYFVEEFTITFNVEGTKTEVKVESGNKVTQPSTPTKEGMTFVGWYLDDSLFDFNTSIEDSFELVARFEEVQIEITNYSGYNEGLFFEATPIAGAALSDYKVQYKLASASTWNTVDSELVREQDSKIRCDIVGLAKGSYQVKLEVNEKSRTLTCEVEGYDRSGYAHFNYSEGVGAYNDDGTLKSDAIVVYVTDNNKNTVTCTINKKTYTGLANILQNQKGSTPLVIRILGTINAATWNKIDYKVNGVTSITPSKVVGANGKTLSLKNYSEQELIDEGFNSLDNDINSGISKLNGLSNSIKYDSSKTEFDSYFNMMDISSAKNVTVEGIGTDAMLYQWGFTWKNCTSIEVRNLTFDDYTEDACSFEGGDDSTTLDGFKTGRIWVHHNTFNEGKNNWDVCNEQDKHEGDGATDFKKNAYITLSYNHYYKNHKTGLIGGSNTQHTAAVTFHHNFYDQCNSRLPLGRQANMHMYNNYYYKSSGTNMSIRASGLAFVENCVFENANNPLQTQDGGFIKSYNNQLINCTGANNAKEVQERTTSITNTNIYGETFDTNSSIFYFDDATQKTKVTNFLDTKDVAEYCKTYSGVLKNNITSGGGITPTPDPDPDPTPTPDPDPQPPVSNTITITFDDLTTGTVESTLTTSTGATVQKGTGTVKVTESAQTILGNAVKKCINVGGKGDFANASILITTTKKANITVYYSNPGSSGPRYIALFNSNGNIGQDPTGATAKGPVVNYTFSNITAGSYAIASAGSGLNIYMIVIEYIE